MARSFLTPLRFPTLSQDPTGSGLGDMYFNSITKTIRYFDGMAWEDLTGNSSGSSGNLEVLPSPPPNAVVGQIYFDSTIDGIRVYTNEGWYTETSNGYLDGGYAATNDYYDIINAGGA